MDLESLKLLIKEAYMEGFDDNSSNVTWANSTETWEASAIKRVIDSWKDMDNCTHDYKDTSSFFEHPSKWVCTKCKHMKVKY